MALSPKTLDAYLRVLAKHGRTLATIETDDTGRVRLGMEPIPSTDAAQVQVTEAQPTADEPDPILDEALNDPIIARQLRAAYGQ